MVFILLSSMAWEIGTWRFMGATGVDVGMDDEVELGVEDVWGSLELWFSGMANSSCLWWWREVDSLGTTLPLRGEVYIWGTVDFISFFSGSKTTVSFSGLGWALVALMCSYLDLLSPFLGASISFVNSTQWSRQVKDGSLSVSDLCSPSKVRAIQCHFHRERYFVTLFPENGAKRCWS